MSDLEDQPDDPANTNVKRAPDRKARALEKTLRGILTASSMTIGAFSTLRPSWPEVEDKIIQQKATSPNDSEMTQTANGLGKALIEEATERPASAAAGIALGAIGSALGLSRLSDNETAEKKSRNPSPRR